MRKIIIGAAAAALILLPGTAVSAKPPVKPPPPTATVQLEKSSYNVTEGKTFVIKVTRNTSVGSTVVHLTASEGTATTPSDYTAPADTTVTIGSGTTSQTVSITTANDSADEANENFSLALSADTTTCGCQLGRPTSATLTINDNDAAAAVAINDPAAVTEGSDVVFTVTKSGLTNLPASVDWAITAGTATSGSDYPAAPPTNTSGAVAFSSVETSKTITVHTTDDAFHESQETIVVTLSNPQNVSITDGSGLGKINDNDALPAFSVAPASGWEGSNVTFTVTLSAPSLSNQTVVWSTAADGVGAHPASLADACDPGVDVANASATATVTAGNTTTTFDVPTCEDPSTENNETFNVVLSSPSTSLVEGSHIAVGTIKDDEPFSIDVTVDPSTADAVTGSVVETVHVRNTAGDAIPDVGIRGEIYRDRAPQDGDLVQRVGQGFATTGSTGTFSGIWPNAEGSAATDYLDVCVPGIGTATASDCGFGWTNDPAVDEDSSYTGVDPANLWGQDTVVWTVGP